jgi:hypothetical protein
VVDCNVVQKDEIVLSLRPGGGGLSLRPGGGFGGFGMVKATAQPTLPPSTKPSKSSTTDLVAPSVDLGGKDFGIASIISSKGNKEELVEEDRPDGFQTALEKLIYNRQFLLQFQSVTLTILKTFYSFHSSDFLSLCN